MLPVIIPPTKSSILSSVCTWESTYALIDCWVARWVAESLAILSSSRTGTTKSSVPSESSYVAVIKVSVLLENIPPTKSSIDSSVCIWESTYALIDCWVAKWVSLLLAILSSSNTGTTRSNVPSESSYVTVMKVSVLLENIGPMMSWTCSDVSCDTTKFNFPAVSS